jgi:hypothetical protein
MDIKHSFKQSGDLKSKYFAPSNNGAGADLQHLHVEELRNLMGLVDASVPPVFNSNRRIWGQLIVWIKTSLVSLFWPMMRIGLRRQTQLNHFVWSLTYSSIQMQKEIDQLKAEVEALKARSK